MQKNVSFLFFLLHFWQLLSRSCFGRLSWNISTINCRQRYLSHEIKLKVGERGRWRRNKKLNLKNSSGAKSLPSMEEQSEVLLDMKIQSSYLKGLLGQEAVGHWEIARLTSLVILPRLPYSMLFFFTSPSLQPAFLQPDLLASHFRTDWLSWLGFGNLMGSTTDLL